MSATPVRDSTDDLVLDDVEGGLFRVHARAFTDPGFFELEKQRVFGRCWMYAAHTSELATPGSFVSRRIGGKDLILTRDEAGAVHAFVNACLHRGSQICRQASGCAKVLQCPYHGWSYDLAGRLVGLPGPDAYDENTFRREAMTLRTVGKIDDYRGFLFVHARADAEPLERYLAGAREFIDLLADQGPGGIEVLPGCHQYTIRANWKLVAENGIDNYHFRTLHRRYLNFVRDRGGEPTSTGVVQPRGRAFGNGHGGTEHEMLSSLGRMAGRWGPLFPEKLRPMLDERARGLESVHGAERARRITFANRNVRLFPNVYFLDNHNTTIRTFYPTAVDQVDVTEWALAPRGEPEELRHERLRTHSGIPGPASFTSPDDIETLERCQRGLSHDEVQWIDCSRGMKRAVPVPTDELQHRAFFRYWHELMTESRVRHPHAT